MKKYFLLSSFITLYVLNMNLTALNMNSHNTHKPKEPSSWSLSSSKTYTVDTSFLHRLNMGCLGSISSQPIPSHSNQTPLAVSDTNQQSIYLFIKGKVISKRYQYSSSPYDDAITAQRAVKLTIVPDNFIPFFSDNMEKNVITVWTKDRQMVDKAMHGIFAKNRSYYFNIKKHFIQDSSSRLSIAHLLSHTNKDHYLYHSASDKHVSPLKNSRNGYEVLSMLNACNGHCELTKILTYFNNYRYIIDNGEIYQSKKSNDDRLTKHLKFVEGDIVKIVDANTQSSFKTDEKCTILLKRSSINPYFQYYDNKEQRGDNLVHFSTKNADICLMARASFYFKDSGKQVRIYFNPHDSLTVDSSKSYYKIIGLDTQSKRRQAIPISTSRLNNKDFVVLEPAIFQHVLPIKDDEFLQHSDTLTLQHKKRQNTYQEEFMKKQQEYDTIFQSRKDQPVMLTIDGKSYINTRPIKNALGDFTQSCKRKITQGLRGKG